MCANELGGPSYHCSQGCTYRLYVNPLPPSTHGDVVMIMHAHMLHATEYSAAPVFHSFLSHTVCNSHTSYTKMILNLTD